MAMSVKTDVLVVGAGPIGIEVAVALKRAGVDYRQLDAGQIGSTIQWYAPQTQFFSSPDRIAISGVPLLTVDQTKATREEYLNYLRSVVLQFDLAIHTFERVTRIEKAEDHFQVTSMRSGEEHLWDVKKIVLAIGDMHRPRLIGVPGEDLPHVSHYLADPHHYFRRRVLIVGGKNSAVEAAIRCTRVGARVTVSYRGGEFDPDRVKFWLLPEIRAMIRDGRVTFLPGTVVREIHQDRAILARADGSSDERIEVEADCVLMMTGYEQDKSLFEEAGIALEGEALRPSFDKDTMETNVQGIFVAGTAAAGTQQGGVKEFIETSHVHVDRIVAAILGQSPPETEAPHYVIPES